MLVVLEALEAAAAVLLPVFRAALEHPAKAMQAALETDRALTLSEPAAAAAANPLPDKMPQ
jgi:hypothetical protein